MDGVPPRHPSKRSFPRPTTIEQLASSKESPYVFTSRIYAARNPNFNNLQSLDPFSETVRRHMFFGLMKVFRREHIAPYPAPVRPRSPGPPGWTETRLLPQIIKEEIQKITIPPPAGPEKPRQPRKLKETKSFLSTSRKGELRTESFVNFHLPSDPKITPRVHPRTLEALGKLRLKLDLG